MRYSRALSLGALIILSGAAPGADSGEAKGVRVGSFPQETRVNFSGWDGLSSMDVRCVAIGGDGKTYAGTAAGLVQFDGKAWRTIDGFSEEIALLAPAPRGVFAWSKASLYRWDATDQRELLAACDNSGPQPGDLRCMSAGATVFVGGKCGLYRVENKTLLPVAGLNELLGDEREIRQIATASNGLEAVAANSGLYLKKSDSEWKQAFPRSGNQSWAPHDVRGVTCDSRGRLWFASPQGVGCLDGDQWSLYTGHEGLPYNDFTTAAAGEDGAVWFGTRIGAIRFDGKRWSYRQGLRWLPHDEVRSIAVTTRGDAFFATAGGLGLIERRPMTLARKAASFEEAIDKYHRRTPYGYVLSVSRKDRDDASSGWTQSDSDNDGLWTSMYGAGECFAYAATKDPKAKERAAAAFEAVRFLSQVTQGGTPPALPGFPARTILPADGKDPNLADYTPDRDREQQKRDPLWKVIVPRWPKSADGKWYWKCDTSSDELDGHYFLYAVYYDLVAETEAEKARVRDVVLPITDHLIDHDFQLVDHDGQPTRWARFSPKDLNGGRFWPGRGLNSLSVLSYLKVAEHVSGGGAKYREAYDRLVKEHSYATNVTDPKVQNGPGSGNQSDDEMAFMCFYNLLQYEQDARLRALYEIALLRYWSLEQPEKCPLFNYLFAATYGRAAGGLVPDFGIRLPRIPRSCVEDAADTLIRFPLDRFNWGYRNSHRLDITPLPSHLIDSRRHRASLRDGTCLPVDERFFEFWNHDPWSVDSDGDGRTLADGAAFLLPYYLGLFHGFIQEGQS